jgi:A/G-specific adenine glycosylase
MIISTVRFQKFKEKIWKYYRTNGRILPWRKTYDPYKILVSEIMLQQTQVARVIPKYKEFLGRFPNITSLAGARLADVLKTWQGLGYNRRAKYLYQIAQKVVKDHKGKLPSEARLLEELPGIGPNTAGAIMAFAFNKPVVFIETNIRSVFIHEFFKMSLKIHDRIIKGHIAKTLDKTNPREWYYALMDYGAMLKTTKPNPNRASAHHTRQSRFEGSDRQIRGAIIRELIRHEALRLAELAQLIDFPVRRIKMNLNQLTKEGLIVSAYGQYRLA